MVGHNMNIYFREETYHKIKKLISKREISQFVNQAVEKELEKKEQQKKVELRQQLIKGYQVQTKNKKLQKELRKMESIQFEDLKKDE